MATSRTRALPKVKEYTKNLAKSVTFAAIKAITSEADGIQDFISTNKEVFTEAYSSVKNYKDSFKKAKDFVSTNPFTDTIKTSFRNIKEDLKTGNLDNTKREEEAIEAALGLSDLDESFQWSDDDVVIKTSKSPSNRISDAIERSSFSNRKTLIGGVDTITKSHHTSTISIVAAVDRQASVISSSIGSVYTEVNKINQYLSTAMTSHLENSRKFYENQLNKMNELNAMTKELLEMQRNLYKDTSSQKNTSNPYQDIFGYSGRSFNIKEYLKVVKKNFGNMISGTPLGMITSLGGGGGDGSLNPLAAIAANPLGLLMSMIMPELIPKRTRNSIQKFDKLSTGMLAQIMSQINRSRNEGGVTGLLAELLGVRIDKKDKIYTNKYHRGAIPFDGITKQSIIEVIPGYLARIEAAITNGDPKYYDFERGSWRTFSNIKASYKDDERYEALGDNRDILRTFDYAFKQTANASKVKTLRNDIMNMLFVIYQDQYVDLDGNDYKHYQFSSKANYDFVKKYIKENHPEMLQDMVINAQRSSINRSRTMNDLESDSANIVRQIFNNSDFTSKYHGRNNTNYKGIGVIANSYDEHGKNIFYYLRSILDSISNNRRARKAKKNNRTNARQTMDHSTNFSSEDGSSEDGGDSDPDDPSISWEELIKETDEEKQKARKDSFISRLSTKVFGDNALGRFFSKLGNTISRPMDSLANLLDKANNNIAKLILGDGLFKDKNGNYLVTKKGKLVDNVLDLIVYKIETTFDKLHENFNDWWGKTKTKLNDNEFIQNVKTGAKDTFNRFKGTVSGAFSSVRDNIKSAFNIVRNADTNASGGFVTKRGLTMVSPGEIIIPASFDKRIQRQQLALEKRDRARIANSIANGSIAPSQFINEVGLNAEGTVDSSKLKSILSDIWNQSKGSTVGKGLAGGGIGAGIGLLTGFNPLLGALSGAALSILGTSDAFKDFVFGKADESGKRSGGIISKKAADLLAKYGTDMSNFGIAGGVLGGLFGPFGILGGAALGAGIGFLKNNESFKTFLLGGLDEEGNEKKGLISKETRSKVSKFVKKAAPRVAVGAITGMLTGPFGLLGNALLGSGLGLLSTTDKFNEFVFGSGKDTPSLVNAIKNGILSPAKAKINELFDSLKEFGKKHVLEPLKKFAEPMAQAFKNFGRDLIDKVSGGINKVFEKHFGLPVQDFLQQKLFKPLTNLFFKLLKLPLAPIKWAVGGASHALGGIGNRMRMDQIKMGRAGNMTAQQRLDFRKKHKVMSALGDDTLTQDELIASLSDEQLGEFQQLMNNVYESRYGNAKNYKENKVAITNKISAIFNANGGEGYDRVGFNTVNKIVKTIQKGQLDKAREIVMTNGKITPEEKTKIIKILDTYGTDAKKQRDYEKSAAALDKKISKQFGEKYRGLLGSRNINRMLKDEISARKKHNKTIEKAASNGDSVTPTEPVDAITYQTELQKKHAETIIDLLQQQLRVLSGDPIASTSADDEPYVIDEEVASSSRPHKYRRSTKRNKFISRQTKSAEAISEITEEDGIEEAEAEAEANRATELSEEHVSWTKRIHDGLFGAIDKVSNKASNVRDKVKNSFVGKAINKTKEFGQGVLTSISSALNGIGSVVGGKWWPAIKIGGAVGTAFGLWNLIPDGFKEAITKDFLPGIKRILFGETSTDETGNKSSSGGLLSPIVNWYYDQGEFPGIVTKFIDGFLNGVPSLIEKVLPWIPQLVMESVNPVTTQIVPKIVQSLISNLVVNMPSIIDSIFTSLIAAKNLLPKIGISLWSGIFEAIGFKDGVNALKWINEKLDAITNFFTNDGKGWLKAGIDKIKGNKQGASNNSGSNSTKFNQNSFLVKHIKYGNSTIAKNGCAPIAAMNTINNAIGVAESGGYINKNGGTHISYFGDMFNRNGMYSKYTSSRKMVEAALKNGNQVVMLGKDSNSGAFGNRNHFITGVGMSGNNILVDDPAYPGRLSYNKNILGGMKSAVITNPAYNSGYGLSSSTTRYSNNSTIDYVVFLESIVTILINISNNTALLTKVLELLSTRFGINGDTDAIKSAINANNDASKTALMNLLNSGNKSNIIRNKNNDYILQVMQELAKE